MLVNLVEITNIIEEIHEKNEAFKITDLKVNGHDLMALGFKGKEIGDQLKRLLEIVIENPEKNQKDTLLENLK